MLFRSEIGIVNVAMCQYFGDRVAHGLADAQLALRAAAGGALFVMMGHYKNPDCRHHPRPVSAKASPGLKFRGAEALAKAASG